MICLSVDVDGLEVGWSRYRRKDYQAETQLRIHRIVLAETGKAMPLPEHLRQECELLPLRR